MSLLRTIAKPCPPNCRAKQLPREPRGGTPLLNAAEVLTLVVGGAWRGLTDKAKLYCHLQMYHRQEFPRLGAYSKFGKAANRSGGELRARLARWLHRNRQAQGPYPLVLHDATAIAVCHIARVRQPRTFRAWAKKSKTGRGWW